MSDKNTFNRLPMIICPSERFIYYPLNPPGSGIFLSYVFAIIFISQDYRSMQESVRSLAGVLLMAEEEKKSEEKKGLVAEFMDFLMKYQVIGLAVAFIIGAAATAMVTALVADIIMPIIAVIIPGGDWRSSVLQLGPVKLAVGDFVGAIINFIIIALVVFIIVKFMMKEDATKKR